MTKNSYTIYQVIKNDTRQRKVIDFLREASTNRKFLLKLAMLTYYPNAVDENGNLSKDFGECVKRYVKPYKKPNGTDDHIFINWNRKNDTDKLCLQMLKHLKGGYADFITEIIFQAYGNFLCTDTSSGPENRSKKSPNKTIPEDTEPADYEEDDITEEEIEALNSLDPTGYLQAEMDALISRQDDFGFR